MPPEIDIENLMDNPDGLDNMDDDAILALAGEASVPEGEAEEHQLATDEEEAAKKAAEAAARDSENKASDKLGKAEPTDDEIKAPIKSRDGEHTIPYDVLEGTRRSLRTKSQELDTATTELAAQKAENQRLQEMLEKAKAGENVDNLDDNAGKDTGDRTPEEEFEARNGMSMDDFTKEYGAPLTKLMMDQIKESMETRSQLQSLLHDRQERVNHEEEETANTVQSAIDAIPELAALQAAGDERWDEAVRIDNALKALPRFHGKDNYQERFKAVAQEMGLKVDNNPGKGKETSGKNNDGLDNHVPTSMSDIPGGSPAAESERQAVDSLDAATLTHKFENMTQKQQDEFLANL